MLRAETTTISTWEKFTLLCLDNDRVALETFHDRFVTATDGQLDGNWVLRAETRDRLAWEEFTLVEAESGEELPCAEVFKQLEQEDVRIALKTCHGRFVTAMDDQPGWNWELWAETENVSDWEKFTLRLQE